MAIAVLHVSNLGNYGAQMMAVNFISLTHKLNPGEVIFVDTDKDEDKKYLEDYFEGDICYLDEALNYSRLSTSKIPIFKKVKHMLSALGVGKKFYNAGIEKVFFLGGDDFSKYYPFRGVVLSLLKILSLNKYGVEVVLFGQTIGPFDGWKKAIVSNVLKRCKIVSRDDFSKNYIFNEMKLKSEITVDLASIDLPSEKVKKDRRVNVKNKFSDYLLLVPSGLWYKYAENYEDYLNRWEEICTLLIERGHRLVLLPHVFSEKSSDINIIINVSQRLYSKGFEPDKIMVIHDRLSIAEVRELIANATGLVSGRMHAVVSAIVSETPALALSYSIKFRGVLSHMEGLDYGIVECSQEKDCWKLEQFSSTVVDEITVLIKNKKGGYRKNIKTNEESLMKTMESL